MGDLTSGFFFGGGSHIRVFLKDVSHQGGFKGEGGGSHISVILKGVEVHESRWL